MRTLQFIVHASGRLRSVGTVVVEQANAPTASVSCPDCEIPERSGFAFHNSHYSKVLRRWLQSGRVQVAGWQGGGSEDNPSVQLFVVEDCRRS